MRKWIESTNFVFYCVTEDGCYDIALDEPFGNWPSEIHSSEWKLLCEIRKYGELPDFDGNTATREVVDEDLKKELDKLLAKHYL